MIVQLKNGRKVEVMVGGTPDEPEILDAVYVTNPGRDVTDEDMDYIETHCFAELSEAAMDRIIMQAEYAYEGER